MKGTRYIKLNIIVDSLTTIGWYVDDSYNVHSNCKGHTGMMMTLGAGASMSMSKGHMLNAKSLTKAEVVGAYNVLPYMLWGKCFIEAQGHIIDHNFILQENKSTIFLAENRMMCSSKKTKHMRHRFYLIKDRIDGGGCRNPIRAHR